MNTFSVTRRDPLFVIYSLTIASVTAFFVSNITFLAIMFAGQALIGVVILRRPALWRLAALVGAALGVAFVNAVASADLEAGVRAALRVLAIVTGGALIFPTLDVTTLADAMGQRWKLPQRFVLGALVAMRQVETFRSDLRSIQLARRIQGQSPDHLLGRIRAFPSLMFTFLVSALRQGSRLSLAMQARGLSTTPRTWSRPVRPEGWDWLMLMAVGLASWLIFALS